MSWKKGIIGLVVAGALVSVYAMVFSKNGEAVAAKYRTARIERGDIIMSVTATGTLNAVQTVQVGSQVSGTIAELHADFNALVREGQVVAQIDPTFLQAQVTEAEANLERSRASVEEARRNLDRARALVQQQLASQAELDQREAAYQTAMAGRKQTEAALERAGVNLKYATIRTPISGVVISRDVEIGQTVAASLQAPTLFTIANDLTKMKLETNIDEADIGKIREGQRVAFTVDAYPETPFEGQVAQIRLSPVTAQNVVTYPVIVDVPNPELKLRPGMTANVTILVDQKFGVLRVPTVALRFRPSMQERPGMGAQGQEQPQGLWARVSRWFGGSRADSSASSIASARPGSPVAFSGGVAPGVQETLGRGSSGSGAPASSADVASSEQRNRRETPSGANPGMSPDGSPDSGWTPSPEMLARMRERFGQDVPDSVLIARMRERMAQRGGMGGMNRGGGMRSEAQGSGAGPVMFTSRNSGEGQAAGMRPEGGAGGMNRAARPLMLWSQGADGRLTPIPIRTGISDGTYIEVMSDNLIEGQEIILAATSDNAAVAGRPQGGGMFPGAMGGGGFRR